MKRTIFFILLTISAESFGQKKMDEPISYKDDLSFEWRNHADTLKLVARSKLLVPLQINLHSRKEDSLLNSILLKPKDSTELVNLTGSEEDSIVARRFLDSVRIGYFWGHESLIKPNLDYAYRFPFKKGEKVEVSQSFNGKSTHNSEQSRYAIDFQLDIGDPVYAARGGTVIKVIDWFTKRGGEELRDAANKIIILHDDGTMANYVHLDYKGSFVKEGQKVEKGEKIGIAGLTGFTRGPHLHFVVRKENDISIPVYFEGYMGKKLKQGKRYKVKN
jgi:murein DD-endopeptidase MepM/ murein hydrolase activator NlpD